MPLTRSERSRRRWTRLLVIAGFAVAVVAAGSAFLIYGGRSGPAEQKPVILYVNQGNGVVNGSGFGAMLGFASDHGFNTVFFQVYRGGRLLFSPVTLGSFVNQTHAAGLKIFLALYITNASQTIPESLYGLREDGVSLDMSALPLSAQQSRLSTLKSEFRGETAVTTTDMTSPLRPDLLVLETYGAGYQQYIKTGIVGSVGVFATSSQADYQSQFQYALQNSDGVMVFDYYGLQKAGY